MDRMLLLAEMDLVLGKPEEAMKKLNNVWESAVDEDSPSHQRRILRNLAIAYLGMKQIAEAQRKAEEYKGA